MPVGGVLRRSPFPVGALTECDKILDTQKPLVPRSIQAVQKITAND